MCNKIPWGGVRKCVNKALSAILALSLIFGLVSSPVVSQAETKTYTYNGVAYTWLGTPTTEIPHFLCNKCHTCFNDRGLHEDLTKLTVTATGFSWGQRECKRTGERSGWMQDTYYAPASIGGYVWLKTNTYYESSNSHFIETMWSSSIRDDAGFGSSSYSDNYMTSGKAYAGNTQNFENGWTYSNSFVGQLSRGCPIELVTLSHNVTLDANGGLFG